MKKKIEKVRLKLLALIDVLINDRFYLVTFNDKDEIKYRTQYGINEEEAIEILNE